MQRGDLPTFDLNGGRVLAFVIDVVMTVCFELFAHQSLGIMMMLRRHRHCERYAGDKRQSKSGDQSWSESWTIMHGWAPKCDLNKVCWKAHRIGMHPR